jgi:molecular chaperone GrpE
MPASDDKRPNSGNAPAPSATTTRVAEGAGGTPEREPDYSDAHLPAEDGHGPEAPVPAGEPEAPVAPAVAEPQGGDPDSTEHERQLERDLDELAAKAQKADEYLELAQRTRADFENYRKRAARETAAAQQRGVIKLVRELLPAVDNLDRAVEAVDGSQDDDELVSGIKLVHAEVIAALGRAGVERFSPEGERFDPEHHEAVAQQPVEGAESGTVAEVYQRGYRLGDSVIRPARVLVAG